MKYIANYELEIGLYLTNEQFDFITERISEGEYSHENQHGGFWFGKRNGRIFRQENRKEDPDGSLFPVYLTSRQLDKVTKRFEDYGRLPWSPNLPKNERNELGHKMYNDLFKVLKSAIEQRNEVNNKSIVLDTDNGQEKEIKK